MENSLDIPQKTENRTTIWSSYPTLGYLPNNMKPLFWKDTCIPMLTASLLTTAKLWKQPKCPWTDEWIMDDRWMAMNRWMDNGILLSHKEMRSFHLQQHRRILRVLYKWNKSDGEGKYHMISLICGIQKTNENTKHMNKIKEKLTSRYREQNHGY